MYMKRLIRRLLSCVLVMTMLLQQCPLDALAVTDDPVLPVDETGETAEILNDGRADSTVIEGEVTGLRGEYEKHFRLSDGTFLAAEYSIPVHYNADGVWKDIDNTLTYSNDTNLYEADNGVTEQAFYPDLQDGTVMSVVDGDTALKVALAEPDTAEVHDSTEAGSADENDSMNVQNAEAAAGDAGAAAEIVPEDAVSPDAAEAEAAEPPAEPEEQTVSEEAAATAADEPAQNEIAVFDHNAAIEILTSEETADYNDAVAADEEIKENEAYTMDDVIPDTLSNAVIYRNVYPGVDLKYETVSYSTKESIILNEEAKGADSYSFVFSLNLTGMYPVLNEDGSITLYKQDPQ